MLDDVRAAWAPRVLSVLRIMTGLLLLQHGTAKYLQFPHVAAFDNMASTSLPGIGGIIEFICGVLVTIGLFTPIAAFIASGELAFIYFYARASASFFPIMNRGELEALWCFVFFYLAFAGGGPWSIDALMRKKD